MEGKIVEATGILHFQHFKSLWTDTIEQPPDYYFFEMETVRLRVCDGGALRFTC
jgi:hypothetical protein